MLGCYDFCAHYDWTFDWIEREGGEADLHRYWNEAISQDSQRHAAELIEGKGLDGMMDYWGHTLNEEAPDGGFSTRIEDGRFLLEMTDCPSRGFLLRNGVEFSKDYCDHCIGWIGPVMEKAGFEVHHAHNHQGQCYWEYRPKEGASSPSIEQWKQELRREWEKSNCDVDDFNE